MKNSLSVTKDLHKLDIKLSFLISKPHLNFFSTPPTLKYLRIIKLNFFFLKKNFSKFNFDFAYGDRGLGFSFL